MNRIFYAICSITLILHLVSCEEDKKSIVYPNPLKTSTPGLIVSDPLVESNIKKLTSIKYGTSFGMCNGFCFKDLKIENLTATLNQRQRFPTDQTKVCIKTITEADVEAIRKLLNTDKLALLPEVIGCPDCADGGAEWIEIEADGKIYKTKFDYNKAPNDIAAAVLKIRALQETLTNCK